MSIIRIRSHCHIRSHLPYKDVWSRSKCTCYHYIFCNSRADSNTVVWSTNKWVIFPIISCQWRIGLVGIFCNFQDYCRYRLAIHVLLRNPYKEIRRIPRFFPPETSCIQGQLWRTFIAALLWVIISPRIKSDLDPFMNIWMDPYGRVRLVI